MRELTLLGVYHPEFMDNEWQRVDHPTVEPLQRGNPTLGWDGDPRLVVYLHKPSQTFMLWRLENDNEYRAVAKLPPGASITPESMNACIRNLIRIDSRRGFNPLDDVEASMAAQDKAAESHRQAFIADFADKFHAALAWSHLPGVSHTRIRNARRKG